MVDCLFFFFEKNNFLQAANKVLQEVSRTVVQQSRKSFSKKDICQPELKKTDNPSDITVEKAEYIETNIPEEPQTNEIRSESSLSDEVITDSEEDDACIIM